MLDELSAPLRQHYTPLLSIENDSTLYLMAQFKGEYRIFFFDKQGEYRFRMYS